MPRAELRFLVDPLDGYTPVLPAEVEQRLSAAYGALMSDGRAEVARQAAHALLETDPQLAPATVLAAQAAFVEGVWDEAAGLVRPLVETSPSYTAAALLLGRSFEKLDRPVDAYAAYRPLQGMSGTAAERAEALLDRVLEILRNRVADAARRQRFDQAEADLARLREWAPESAPTLEAAWELARDRGDREAELTAVTALSQKRPDDDELLARRAELEVDVGNPHTGLEILQGLVGRHPDDRRLAGDLAYAKFRWRLSVVPADVQALAARPELTRGDLARLVYWAVPGVRFAKPASVQIATDILDDPRREEIARVVNLGLMDVDPTLHRFSPDAPATRLTSLRVALRLLAGAERPVACVATFSPAVPSADEVCAAAVRCALLPGVADCLPGAAVSGRDALDTLRRTVDLLGSR